ncbi:site-specific DNA-methyltransferase [Limosilactobacillus urinaemulieris]|uniref:DNA-methyltransferase n=1 Tax=Limosilactobacillus urinaemulieris TaxID=2742600 RepID=UPI002E2CEE35|nr:site-specific DNA-methyltransferase [Limosilactobacillus urinaemulieris]
MSVRLFKGDCLKLLKQIENKSVDLVLADLPYGMTANKWDSVIPLKPLFEQYQRIIKDHGAVLLFGMGKFGASLIMNAPKKMPFRYDWVWQKTMAVGFLWSHHMPLRAHENVYVFYKHLPTYNPQMRMGFKLYVDKGKNKPSTNYHITSGVYPSHISHGERYPIDVIEFSNRNYHSNHPTEKPVDLLEYLIKTYTDEGMTVLDNTMGSGSTGVAAVNLKRNFIGMELDDKYFKIANERIEKADRSTLASF